MQSSYSVIACTHQ